MDKPNYNFYASIGPSFTQMQQKIAVLDTGATGNFVRPYVLP